MKIDQYFSDLPYQTNDDNVFFICLCETEQVHFVDSFDMIYVKSLIFLSWKPLQTILVQT